MIFRRRKRPTPGQRLREVVSPRKGWWRGFDYIAKRVRRLPDSPHRIALGCACGVFASFTPFFGLHLVVAAILARILRGNLLAGLFGTVIGNPLTFPMISIGSLYAGRRVMGRAEGVGDFGVITSAFANGFGALWSTVTSWFGHGTSQLGGLALFMDEIFLPYLIGGAILGLIAAAVCYWIIGPLVAAGQELRRRKLKRAQERQQAARAGATIRHKSERGENDDE